MLWALLKPSSLTVRRRDGEDRAAERNAQAAKKSPPEGLGRPQASAAGGFIGEEQQCKQVPSFICVRSRMHAYVRAYACTCVRIHAHAHPCACICMQTCTHTHGHVRTQACSQRVRAAQRAKRDSHWGISIVFFQISHVWYTVIYSV
jgi:hypothetical protein